MKLSNYGQFHDDLKLRGIEYAAEHTVILGFDSVEFLGLSQAAKDPSATARILASHGLSVSCFSEGINLLDTSRRSLSEMIDHLCRCGDSAAELGSPFLHHTLILPLTLPPNAPELSEVLPIMTDAAEQVANYCEKLGLVCLYEPQGMYFNGNGLEIFFDEMKKRCRNIGICGDVGNSLFVDYSPSLVFDKFAPQVKHVHLKDYLVEETELQGRKGHRSRGGKWLYDTELGEGVVDIPYCMSKLKEVGYSGAYSFELTGDDATVKKAVENFKNVCCK